MGFIMTFIYFLLLYIVWYENVCVLVCRHTSVQVHVYENTRGGPRLTLCVFLNCSLSYTLKRGSLWKQSSRFPLASLACSRKPASTSHQLGLQLAVTPTQLLHAFWDLNSSFTLTQWVCYPLRHPWSPHYDIFRLVYSVFWSFDCFPLTNNLFCLSHSLTSVGPHLVPLQFLGVFVFLFVCDIMIFLIVFSGS